MAAASSVIGLFHPLKAANSNRFVVIKLNHQIGLVAIANTVRNLIRGGMVKPFLISLYLIPLTGVSTVRIKASKPASFA